MLLHMFQVHCILKVVGARIFNICSLLLLLLLDHECLQTCNGSDDDD